MPSNQKPMQLYLYVFPVCDSHSRQGGSINPYQPATSYCIRNKTLLRKRGVYIRNHGCTSGMQQYKYRELQQVLHVKAQPTLYCLKPRLSIHSATCSVVQWRDCGTDDSSSFSLVTLEQTESLASSIVWNSSLIRIIIVYLTESP